LVDQQSTTYSHAALVRLLDAGAGVVVCGRNHQPLGLLLPLGAHTEVVWRMQEQVAASKPLRKQLWQQLIVAKIRAQAGNFAADDPLRRRLLALAGTVRSGDPTNVEAQAAKVYWSAWLGEGDGFRRDPDAEDAINAMLNYGYAVVRAAVGRALVSAGLHPALGLHHHHRANAFCLADDLMEPLRPLVDRAVRALHLAGQVELDPPAKREILKLLTATVRVGEERGPLMVGLHRTVASLVRCLRRESKELLIPQWQDEAD
jgi:CRISPR-associated protein Cas1